MSSKVKIGAALAVMMGLAALFQSQQLKIKRLTVENANLRSQLTQMGALQAVNKRLGEKLNAALASLQTNQSELLRLRAQALKLRQLEQEYAQLKAERQRSGQPTPQAQLAVGAPQPGPATGPTETGQEENEVPSPGITDLGKLELPEGVPTRIDLGGGTSCVITPTATDDGNNLMLISVGVAKADGTFSELGTSRIIAKPGQHCAITVGDKMIAMAVTLKPQ